MAEKPDVTMNFGVLGQKFVWKSGHAYFQIGARKKRVLRPRAQLRGLP